MIYIGNLLKKSIFITILFSVLLMFVLTPSANAKLDLKDGDFYYGGTTEGTYVVTEGIFAWLLSHIGAVADWLLGILTMGVRMVFVGWTALLEDMLTNVLQSTVTTAETKNENGKLEVNLIQQYTDSKDNLTIERIVYNKVPMFNANIFDMEYDATVTGTGAPVICRGCNEKPDKCTSSCGCGCKDPNSKKHCDACETYEVFKDHIDDITVVKIKHFVAAWYFAIRLLACAAMLALLIGVGIKMLLSTVASEKAVYKRMLVDWVVGMILIFTLHYFMILIITINDIIVEEISNVATNVNKVKMMQLTDKDGKSGEEQEFTSSELEVKIYEEIRTRAYDARASVGFSGMIMYMTLVYFAFKFSVIYLKRLLTVIVLTLMAPGVGVSYALQKVLTGRSSSFSDWMSEYIFTVIIQVVHALIYSVFVSQALFLSLENVAGMIVGLILLNYVLKADKLFRKIFKFSGKNSDFANSAADSGNLEDMQNNAKAMIGVATGAKPLAKTALALNPIAHAANYGIRRAGVAAMRRSSNKAERAYNQLVNDEIDAKIGDRPSENEEAGDYEERRMAARQEVVADLAANGIVDPRTAIKNNERAVQSNYKDYFKTESDVRVADGEEVPADGSPERAGYIARRNEVAERAATQGGEVAPTTLEIAQMRFNQAINIDNTFNINQGNSRVNYDSYGRKILGKDAIKARRRDTREAMYGSYKTDPVTGKITRTGSVYSKLTPAAFFGVEPKQIKEFNKKLRGQALGNLAMLTGMMTIVAHPKAGIAMAAGGFMAATDAKAYREKLRDKYIGPKKNLSNRRYKINEFTPYNIAQMKKSATASAKGIRDAIVAADISSTHTKLVDRIKSGTLNAQGRIDALKITDFKAGLATVGAGVVPAAAIFAAAPTVVGVGAVATMGVVYKKAKRSHAKSPARQETIKNYNNAMREVIGEATKVEQAAYVRDVERTYQQAKDDKTKASNEYYAAMKAADDAIEEALISMYASIGMKYDKRTKTFVPDEKATEEQSEKREKLFGKGDFSVSEGDLIGPKASVETLNASQVKQVNIEIDRAIAALTAGNADVSETTLLEEVNARLVDAKVIEKGQDIKNFFKVGKIEETISVRKKASDFAKGEATRIAEELEKEEVATLDEIIAEEVAKVDVTSPEKAKDPKATQQSIVSKVMERYQAEAEKTKTKKQNIYKDGMQAVDPTADGTQQVNTSDGSKSVQAPKAQFGQDTTTAAVATEAAKPLTATKVVETSFKMATIQAYVTAKTNNATVSKAKEKFDKADNTVKAIDTVLDNIGNYASEEEIKANPTAVEAKHSKQKTRAKTVASQLDDVLQKFGEEPNKKISMNVQSSKEGNKEVKKMEIDTTSPINMDLLQSIVRDVSHHEKLEEEQMEMADLTGKSKVVKKTKALDMAAARYESAVNRKNALGVIEDMASKIPDSKNVVDMEVGQNKNKADDAIRDALAAFQIEKSKQAAAATGKAFGNIRKK